MSGSKGKSKKGANKLDRRKRSARTKAFKDALKRPPSNDVILVQEQRLFFLQVVQEMLNDPQCYSFSRPVTELWDVNQLPGYFDKVSTPMDLGTIKDNISKNEYIHEATKMFDFRSVVENVHLVFKNCRAYNAPASNLAKLSKKLMAEFDRKVCEMPLDTNIDDPHIDGASSILPPGLPLSTPSLGTPISSANRSKSTVSPAMRKRTSLGPLTANLSPATPENVNGSPFKRRRANLNTKSARTLDFCPSQEAPPVPIRKSADNEPVANADRKLDASINSARTEPDKLLAIDDGMDFMKKRHDRPYSVKRAGHEEFFSSILGAIIDDACAIQNFELPIVAISDSSQSSRDTVVGKTKLQISDEAASDRANNQSQKRKRPRRIIQETPPSDTEQEVEEIASIAAIDSINDTQAFHAGSTRNERRSRPGALSTKPNRRRKQKRNTFDATAEADIHSTLGAICYEVMGDIGTVDQSYESIVSWIGGEVSEAQLEETVPAESSEDEPPALEPTAHHRRRNGPLLSDESPLDGGEVVVVDEDDVPERRTRATQRDRPISTQNGSRAFVTGKSDSVLGSLELPTIMKTPPLPISGDLLSLNRCSTSLDIAVSTREDEKKLLYSSLDFRDWLYSAEQLDLDDEAREWLQSADRSNVLNALSEFLRRVEDANLVTDGYDSVALDSRRQTVIIGSCARFLGNNLTKDLLSPFFDILLRAKDAQMKKGTDSLVYLLLNPGTGHGRKYELVQLLWVSFLDACRFLNMREFSEEDNSIDIGSKHVFWSMFNGKYTTATFGQISRHCDEQGFAKGDELVEKTMESLLTFGSLFAYSLVSSEKTIPVVYTSNWDIIGNIVDSLAQRKYRTVEQHRRALFTFLSKVCMQFADRLWKVEESFVMKVLETIKSICAKYNSPCSCVKIPPFLSQFNVIGDIRTRRRSIPKFLCSECDCALFLAWIYIAQQEKVSPKSLGKLSRYISSVMKGKGIQSDSARALTHHLGLTLAISRGIGLGKPDPEKLLRSMLFAKVPNLSSVFDDASRFDPKIMQAWASVLDTVSLRCRHLLAFGQGIHLYSDFMCSRISQTLHCIERPELDSKQNVKKRETRRVLQSMFVELLVKMLSTFVKILQLVVQFVTRGSYTNFPAIDSLLTSFEPLLKRLGSFSSGLISQIRSNKMSANSSRQDILSAIVSFVEQGLALCTVRAKDEFQNSSQNAVPASMDIGSHGKARSSSEKHSAFVSFSKTVHSSILDTLIIMVQSPVLENGSTQDMVIRRAASRALGRTLGLCSIGPEPVYSTVSSNLLFQVLSKSKMSVLSFSSNQPLGLIPPVILQGKDGILMKKVELLLQSEFWSVILDPTWSRVVLALTEQIEVTIFGLWTILLVVTYKESAESDLVKAVDTLSFGIQRAAEADSNLEKWFYETSFGLQCHETSSADPMDQSKYEMSGKVRLETFVDCLCVILKTWKSTNVYNLITFIRSYINLGVGDKARNFEGSTSEYFRSSKDIAEGEESILHTQILAVLFVVHGSLSLPSSSQYRGGRAGYEKSMANSYLAEISDSLTRAMQKLRKGMKTHDDAIARVQVLVMTGLSTSTKGVRGMELSITFGRFVKLCGTKKGLQMLITWNDGSKIGEFLNRKPFTINPERARDEQEKNRLRGVLKEGQTYRRLALTTLVLNPIALSGTDTSEFRQGLEGFCGLLEGEILVNLRHVNCGLWPDVCRVVKEIGKRAKRHDWRQGGEIVEMLKNKIMKRLESSCTTEEGAHFRKELGFPELDTESENQTIHVRDYPNDVEEPK